jgi:hypothetical protein
VPPHPHTPPAMMARFFFFLASLFGVSICVGHRCRLCLLQRNITSFRASHPEGEECELYMLSRLDLDMALTGNVEVARDMRDIAQEKMTLMKLQIQVLQQTAPQRKRQEAAKAAGGGLRSTQSAMPATGGPGKAGQRGSGPAGGAATGGGEDESSRSGRGRKMTKSNSMPMFSSQDDVDATPEVAGGEGGGNAAADAGEVAGQSSREPEPEPEPAPGESLTPSPRIENVGRLQPLPTQAAAAEEEDEEEENSPPLGSTSTTNLEDGTANAAAASSAGVESSGAGAGAGAEADLPGVPHGAAG